MFEMEGFHAHKPSFETVVIAILALVIAEGQVLAVCTPFIGMDAKTGDYDGFLIVGSATQRTGMTVSPPCGGATDHPCHAVPLPCHAVRRTGVCTGVKPVPLDKLNDQ